MYGLCLLWCILFTCCTFLSQHCPMLICISHCFVMNVLCNLVFVIYELFVWVLAVICVVPVFALLRPAPFIFCASVFAVLRAPYVPYSLQVCNLMKCLLLWTLLFCMLSMCFVICFYFSTVSDLYYMLFVVKTLWWVFPFSTFISLHSLFMY